MIVEQHITSLKDIGIDNASEMWKRVKEISGKQPNLCAKVSQSCVTAATLNCYYSKISQDPIYVAPLPKSTCSQKFYQDHVITPFAVFNDWINWKKLP